MELAGLRPTRVSRETRLLLLTAGLAFAALWTLARLRFPEQPTVTSLQPILTQLAPRMVLDDLAAEVAKLQPRLLPVITPYDVTTLSVPPGQTLSAASNVVPALRFGSDVAIALIGATAAARVEADRTAASVIGSDPASGLAVVRVPVQDPQPLSFWTLEGTNSRFLIASELSGAGVSLRPVFAGPLRPIDSPVFSARVWLGLSPDVPAGSFVFTTEGALAGLVVRQENAPAIVPAEAVMTIADRLLSEERRDAGRLGLTVQALSPELARATGGSSGVVVTWVDPAGPSAGKLSALDVIEAVDGGHIATLEHWRARAMRVAANETLTLRVRAAASVGTEKAETREVRVVALADSGKPLLGLTMRMTRNGAEVLTVERASTASRAGLSPGDVITAIANVQKPTPLQVTAAFEAATPGHPIAAAVARGDGHMAVALTKP